MLQLQPHGARPSFLLYASSPTFSSLCQTSTETAPTPSIDDVTPHLHADFSPDPFHSTCLPYSSGSNYPPVVLASSNSKSATTKENTAMVGWDPKGEYRVQRGASLTNTSTGPSSAASGSSGASTEFYQFKCKYKAHKTCNKDN